MKTFAIVILFVFFAKCANAQTVPYGDIEPKLAEYSCTVWPSVDECRHSIGIIEAWMATNPSLAGPVSLYDLQNYYYFLAGRDSTDSKANFEKSIKYNLAYSAVSEEKQKYKGYWNAAVCYAFLKDCGNAMKYLQLSIKSPGSKKRNRDKGTVRGIKRMCGN